MSARRIALVVLIVVVALLSAPAALAPVMNSADLIEVVAPLLIAAVCTWPRRDRPARKSPWIADIDADHPNALSRLDRLNGVGARRPPSS